MNTIRQPAVAGAFYPADQQQLHTMLDGMLDTAQPQGPLPKAIIVPHAGYVYSGPIAASVYARIRQGRDVIRRVVLVGPSHRVGFRGLAVSSAKGFATPFGIIPVDQYASKALLALPFVVELDPAHAYEHSLEVQLPFLQEVLGQFSLVPVVVGDASAEEVSAVLEELWGDEETLIVISSDLSHYQDYATARKMDKATSLAIERLRPQDIGFEYACGRLPISGLLIAAKRRGMKVETVDLRNSGDMVGSRDQVVGYGAYVFEYADTGTPQQGLTERDKHWLLQLARESILHGVKEGHPLPVDAKNLSEPLQANRASFVTLLKQGELRGCIGSLEAHRPLAKDIAENAYAAAFRDPRFKPVQESELGQLEIHLSLLTPAQPMHFTSEQDLLRQIKPGVDGLILSDHGHRGTFLPSVWEQLPEPKEFLRYLKQKAGLPPDYWSESLKVSRYQAEMLE